MLNELTLALTASLLLSAQATAQEKKQPPTAPTDNRYATLWANWVSPFGGAAWTRGI